MATSAERAWVITAPNTATPTVEPIWRKNWLELVATPSRDSGTAFCTARANRPWEGPSPRPSTNTRQDTPRAVVWGLSRVISRTPASIMTAPNSIIGL